MEVVITLVVLAVLVAAFLAISRAGSGRHPEDLSSRAGQTPPPKRDRPAGPGAATQDPEETGGHASRTTEASEADER